MKTRICFSRPLYLVVSLLALAATQPVVAQIGTPPPGTKLWELDLGIVYGSPAIGGDGTLYVPAGNAVVSLYAVTPNGDAKEIAVLAGGGSSPALAPDGTIYVARADGTDTFVAYAPNGTPLWSVPLRVTSTFYGFASPAIAHDATIYVGTEGPDRGLYALRSDGTLKWKFTPAGVSAR